MKIPRLLKRMARRWRGNRAPGRFIKRTYANGAGTRGYHVYLPARYNGQSLPLVVMLHGCRQAPDDFAAGTRMNELADELGFIVAYPSQARSANLSRCWNWFSASHRQREQGEPSLIAGITRQVIERYRVDSRRVYVAGLSAGGAMAAVMGATYPELYAAVGVHSGLLHDSAPRVPTIVFHGDRDGIVHPRHGEPALPKMREESGEAGGRRYTRSLFRDGPRLEHWLVHGAGHAWSGGDPRGSYADAAGPDAAREMLRFFLA